MGDAERDEALRLLGEHFAAGRLDHEEYDDRSSRALTARTRGELDKLFVDLPTESRGGSPSGRQGPAVERRRPRRPPIFTILLIVLVVSIVAGAPWIVLVAAGVLFCTRRSGRRWERGPVRGFGNDSSKGRFR